MAGKIKMQAAYDRSKLKPRILHFGLGAFFRAHLSDYTDAVNRLCGPGWGIRAVKTRPGGDALTGEINKNGGVYTLLETSAAGNEAKVAGALYDTVFYCDEPEKVFELFRQPEFAIVTTTITEKGYCYDFGNDRLDTANPDIAHDLAIVAEPKSVPGIIVRGLALRRAAGLGGITLLSCDNMTNNGRTFKKAVTGFARIADKSLADWIEANVSFPNAMVDRIVPAMTESGFAEVEKVTGYTDRAAIICERFKQWVIEDDFRNGHPDWDKAGAIFTRRVEPFEEMKLRLLNGSHSSLAYCGYLCGYETVDEAINDDGLRKLVKSYWEREAIPTLEQPPGIDLQDYCGRLVERYRNPALKHRLWQIAMDGSQKLPYRLLNGLRANIAAGRDYKVTAFVLAAWLRYISGVDDNDAAIDVRDPLAAEFRKCYEEAANGGAYVAAIMDNERVFGADLPADGKLRGLVTEIYTAMTATGVKDVLAGYKLY